MSDAIRGFVLLIALSAIATNSYHGLGRAVLRGLRLLTGGGR